MNEESAQKIKKSKVRKKYDINSERTKLPSIPGNNLINNHLNIPMNNIKFNSFNNNNKNKNNNNLFNHNNPFILPLAALLCLKRRGPNGTAD